MMASHVGTKLPRLPVFPPQVAFGDRAVHLGALRRRGLHDAVQVGGR